MARYNKKGEKVEQTDLNPSPEKPQTFIEFLHKHGLKGAAGKPKIDEVKALFPELTAKQRDADYEQYLAELAAQQELDANAQTNNVEDQE